MLMLLSFRWPTFEHPNIVISDNKSLFPTPIVQIVDLVCIAIAVKILAQFQLNFIALATQREAPVLSFLHIKDVLLAMPKEDRTISAILLYFKNDGFVTEQNYAGEGRIVEGAQRFYADWHSSLSVTEPNFPYLLRDSILGFGGVLGELKVVDSLLEEFGSSEIYSVKRQKLLNYGPNKAGHAVPFFGWDRDGDKILFLNSYGASYGFSVGDIDGFGYATLDSIHHIYIMQVQNW
ncbi:unnamed protein product [Amaranthus hypochondriacus]